MLTVRPSDRSRKQFCQLYCSRLQAWCWTPVTLVEKSPWEADTGAIPWEAISSYIFLA